MAEISTFNIDTGEVFIRALPGEDLSGWFLFTYDQSGNGSVPVEADVVDTSMPYVSDPDDGFIYYRQLLGPLSSPSGQRDALVLTDDTFSLVDVVGWGKDDDFDLIGGPGDGISISPGDGNYAPGDGPWYSNGPPWETSPPPDNLEPVPPPCFVAGTLLETPRGPVPVEDLQVGQIVSTLSGPKPVLWTGGSMVKLDHPGRNHLRPVKFKAGSLGHSRPTRDVLLSQQHRVHCDSKLNELNFGVSGVLVAAKHLVNGRDITIDAEQDAVSYHHILLEDHYIVNASGLSAETLLPSEWAVSGSALKANAEFQKIFSTDAAMVTKNPSSLAYPVLKKHEAKLLNW